MVPRWPLPIACILSGVAATFLAVPNSFRYVVLIAFVGVFFLLEGFILLAQFLRRYPQPAAPQA
jgi:uncharacterized membrane protein HdeD (DUF308 family)